MSEEERYQDCDGCGERFWGDDDIQKNLRTHVEGMGMLCDACAAHWEKRRQRPPMGTLYFCPVCNVVRHHVFIQEGRVQCRDGCMNAQPYTYQGYLDTISAVMEKTTTDLGIDELHMEKDNRRWTVTVLWSRKTQRVASERTATREGATLREALARALGAVPPRSS